MAIEKYYPELDYWFHEYMKTDRSITLELPPSLEVLKTSLVGENTLFELLFINSYSNDSYKYMFKETTFDELSENIWYRLKERKLYYLIYMSTTNDDEDGENVFELDTETLEIIDELLNYRLNNTVDISSYGPTFETVLGKLIYSYLDLKINNNYIQFDTEESIATNLIEHLFEIYLMNEAHKHLSTVKDILELDVVELRPVRLCYEITDQIIDDSFIDITNTDAPNDNDEVYLYLNGELVDREDYSIISDTSSTIVTWVDIDNDFDLTTEDVIVIDYYTDVDISES